jgi:hypothetical protein
MSTLDQRIAADCQRSGVPFFVENDEFLDRVAAWVASGEEGDGDARPAA